MLFAIIEGLVRPNREGLCARNGCGDGIPNSAMFQATKMNNFDWRNSPVKPARSSCNSWFNNLARSNIQMKTVCDKSKKQTEIHTTFILRDVAIFTFSGE